MVKKFKNQFQVHMKQPKDTIILADIKQRDDELLKSYITRLNKAAAIVQKSNPALVHMVIMMGIKKGTKLYKSLTKIKTRNLS